MSIIEKIENSISNIDSLDENSIETLKEEIKQEELNNESFLDLLNLEISVNRIIESGKITIEIEKYLTAIFNMLFEIMDEYISNLDENGKTALYVYMSNISCDYKEKLITNDLNKEAIEEKIKVDNSEEELNNLEKNKEERENLEVDLKTFDLFFKILDDEKSKFRQINL